MQTIINYIKNHIREDFNFQFYLSITIFLAITITINYIYDFENSIIDAYHGKEIRILYYFMFYGFAYYFTCILYAWCYKKQNILRSWKFWLISLFGLTLLSFDGAFHYHFILVSNYFPAELQYFAIKCFNKFTSFFSILLPLLFIYLFIKRNNQGFYGLSLRNTNWKTNLLLLLIIAPVIIAASFHESFIDFYPTYKSSSAHVYFGVDEWLTMLLYELFYGWDFVAVELLFRGFFVIGMVSILGRGAIIPMVVIYTFLHFGKPLGEAVSSIFGGYILGVIAFYGRQIMTGVTIHLGIAWLMELMAYLQGVWKGIGE